MIFQRGNVVLIILNQSGLALNSGICTSISLLPILIVSPIPRVPDIHVFVPSLFINLTQRGPTSSHPNLVI